MSLGKPPLTEEQDSGNRTFCEELLSDRSIYRLLAREGRRLFPEEDFADLFQGIGRWSIPPQIVAVVMILQRIEGLSDREAVERFTFDVRWKYAAGGLGFDYPGFVHTVLVDMRARLRRSERPNRIFEAGLAVAREAGLVGRKRALDSTALYDAVATQDTVTLIRSAIRSLVRVADPALEARVRACLQRDDDYKAPGKPRCDWDDVEAREKVIDELARDAEAVLSCLEGQTLEAEVEQAAQLIAAVVGQDLERGAEGRFCIARRVAADRIISVVDPEARHGHKTAARGFDGYKGHVSVDPDSEFIVATQVTAGNVADGNAAVDLLAEVLEPTNRVESSEPIEIYGDSAYGTAELIEHIEGAGAEANVKVQGPSGRQGMFSKDDFEIDPQAGMVRCPAGALVQIRVGKDGGGVAFFGAHCPTCPLRSQCTEAKGGRTIQIHPHERTLQRMRDTQKDPKWKERYRSTRPKVERKQAHLMFRRHGGRRSRVRGTERIGQDFALLGAGINLKRLAVLGLHWNGTRWSVA